MGHPSTGFPPVVYVPVTSLPGADGSLALEFLETNDGRLALFAYSALDRLQTFYRADSPWALLSVDDLQRAYDSVPYDLLFLDKRPRPLRDGEPPANGELT